MSTYSYDLTTDIGKIRLKISDKDIVPTSDAHYTDEELQVFLTDEGSVNLAAAAALEAWASSLAESTDSERIGDYSYTKKQVSHMLEIAARLRANVAETPAIDWAEMNLVDIPETIEEDE